MLVFTPDQLFTLNHSRPPSRPTRKTLFALKLWRPSRDRDKSRVSRGRSNVDNVNKQHVQTSPWRVGWLNARSLSNKTGAIHETIDDRRLDVLAVTETWHRSSDDPSLRLSAPSGYTTVDAIRDSDPSHGGIVIFYPSRFARTKIDLPRLSTFEGLCVRLSADGESVTLLTIYRPGSARVTSAFYDELTMVLESLVLLSGPVIVGGDINIHVEDAADADAARLAAVFDAFDLQQHVVGPTHNLGGTLDIVATFSDYRVDSLAVDPPGVISDHSLITCRLSAYHHVSPVLTRVVRSWRKVDRSEFAQAIRNSVLGHPPPPSLSVDELFATYDKVLRDIADRLAPTHTVHSRVHPLSPWFDAECRAIRRDCRRLERRYRRSMSDIDRSKFAAALRRKHASFTAKKNKYWTERISAERGTPAKLWQSLTKILRRDKEFTVC